MYDRYWRFGLPAIDFYAKYMWDTRNPRRRIVRVAWKGAGWHTLSGLDTKPFWLQHEELMDDVRMNWAKFVNRIDAAAQNEKRETNDELEK